MSLARKCLWVLEELGHAYMQVYLPYPNKAMHVIMGTFYYQN